VCLHGNLGAGFCADSEAWGGLGLARVGSGSIAFHLEK